MQGVAIDQVWNQEGITNHSMFRNSRGPPPKQSRYEEASTGNRSDNHYIPVTATGPNMGPSASLNLPPQQPSMYEHMENPSNANNNTPAKPEDIMTSFTNLLGAISNELYTLKGMSAATYQQTNRTLNQSSQQFKANRKQQWLYLSLLLVIIALLVTTCVILIQHSKRTNH